MLCHRPGGGRTRQFCGSGENSLAKSAGWDMWPLVRRRAQETGQAVMLALCSLHVAPPTLRPAATALRHSFRPPVLLPPRLHSSCGTALWPMPSGIHDPPPRPVPEGALPLRTAVNGWKCGLGLQTWFDTGVSRPQVVCYLRAGYSAALCLSFPRLESRVADSCSLSRAHGEGCVCPRQSA